MMLLRQLTVATAFVISLGGSASLVQATPWSRPEMDDAEVLAQIPGRSSWEQRGDGRLSEQLNLSPEQQEALQEIKADYQNRISQRRDALQQERQELKQMMTGNASESQIRAQHQRVQDRQEEVSNLHLDSMLETRNVLNPEQRRQLAELMQERPQERRERWQNRRMFRRESR